MMIFIYSGLFSAEKDNHPIPSFYEKITGEHTASSGLSRSFSEIVRGRFESARTYNQYGIPVFIFFLVQLFQRILVSIIYHKRPSSGKWLLYADVVVSVGFFILCFKGLISEYFQNFY
jgi:hypothetical protein